MKFLIAIILDLFGCGSNDKHVLKSCQAMCVKQLTFITRLGLNWKEDLREKHLILWSLVENQLLNWSILLHDIFLVSYPFFSYSSLVFLTELLHYIISYFGILAYEEIYIRCPFGALTKVIEMFQALETTQCTKVTRYFCIKELRFLQLIYGVHLGAKDMVTLKTSVQLL